MFVGAWAERTPDKPAIIRASTGEVLTYRELNDRSLQVAQYLYASGLRRHDRVALYMENNIRFMEIIWAALRSGIDIVSINRYAVLHEVSYIVNDCGAKSFFSSIACSNIARDVPAVAPNCKAFLMCDGTVDGFQSYEEAIAGQKAVPVGVEWAGNVMPYTSGTTGRPKGVVRKLPDRLILDEWSTAREFKRAYNFNEEMVYLSPAPLYHGAPIRFARAVHSIGGTIVMMEKFDALESLKLIGRHKVTHSQWVPTMFVRMLRLPEEIRTSIDLSSHQIAVHAAAPCPIEVKRQIIGWWGPIVHEYYGATDGCVDTEITTEEWLVHPGSVGKAPATTHICDEDGDEVAAGERGLIYGEANQTVSYLNDTDKTRAGQNPKNPNWWTTGDIGYVKDGYLYLSGRRGFMIISGGVNIYPQAIEDAMIQCEKLADVAVIGVPHDSMGEEVKAIVELAPGELATDETVKEILQFTSGKIAAYMVPKSIDFVDALPRLPTGKLYKQELLRKYWPNK